LPGDSHTHSHEDTWLSTPTQKMTQVVVFEKWQPACLHVVLPDLRSSPPRSRVLLGGWFRSPNADHLTSSSWRVYSPYLALFVESGFDGDVFNKHRSIGVGQLEVVRSLTDRRWLLGISPGFATILLKRRFSLPQKVFSSDRASIIKI